MFHHDNVRSHVSKETLQRDKDLKWVNPQQPPYSPDWSLSDFQLFRSLQNNLNDNKIGTVQSVDIDLTTLFHQKIRSFYENVINKLLERRKTVAKNNRDYILD